MAPELIDRATEILDKKWSGICTLSEQGNLQDWLDDHDLLGSIRNVVNSKIKSYHYALPTQLIAKLADPNLDCRCIQAGRGGPGAFDARSIADAVVVAFDQRNERVLGGSPEPYVNKPLRCEEFSDRCRSQQRNKQDWDHVCAVLNAIEDRNDPAFTELVFKQVLTEIHRQLAGVRVVYPVPIRISLKRNIHLIQEFLSQQSGGDRLLAMAAALFVVIGRRFGLYANVRRASITTADGAAGMLADLECVSEHGDILMVVEVKDRVLTISQMRSKIPDIRERHVSEIFFIAQRGILSKEENEIINLIDHEYTSGHNLYILNLIELSQVALALLGEQGRRDFLLEIGGQLDQHSDIVHRRAWALLLSKI